MDSQSADLSALRINRNAPTAAPRGVPRWFLVGIPALLVIVVAVVLLARGLGGGIPVRLTPAVLISPAQANVLAIASGYVVAQRKAAVASKGTGRLVYLGVVEGDRVKAGQVIARIEDADVRAQLAQAEANLAVGKADLHDAQTSLDRQRSLRANNLASQADVDAAEARLQRVTRDHRRGQAAGVDAAQVAVENTNVRAPFDGTVLTKTADVGEVVSPLTGGALAKASVVTLADLASLQVEVDVSESSLEQVSVGEPCEIVLDAYPDVRYPGSVARIVPTADRAKATVQVKVAFRHYDARVLPEMSAKVHFLPRATSPSCDGYPVGDRGAGARRGPAGWAVGGVHRDGRPSGRSAGDGGSAARRPVAIVQGFAVGTAVIDSLDDRVRRGVKVNVQKPGTPQ